MARDTLETFNKAASLKELRAAFARYLAAGAEVVADSAKLEALTGLTPSELDRICAVHFLSSDEAIACLELLPELVRWLPSTAIQEQIQTRGFVQGQVRWAETVQVRLRSRDPSVFVCARPERRYQTLQGQLLKATVENLHDAVRRTSWLGTSPVDLPPNLRHDEGPLKQRVLAAARTVEPLLDSRKLREIARVPLRPEVLSALRSREALNPLCDLYESYERLIVARETSALIEALSTRFFAPDVDKVFELLVAFRLARALRLFGWVEQPPRGILGPRTPVATLMKDGRTITIFWQTSVWDTETARHIGKFSSALHSIVESSGSHIRRYRPDLVVEIANRDGSRAIRIGEVKLTSVPGSHAEARGVLECLGYLRDAQGIGLSGVDLRGFVVAWNATGRPQSGLIAIADQKNIRALAQLFEQA